MHLSDLGIDPKTKQHTMNPMTAQENAFLGILWVDHVGQGKKVGAEHLARAFAREIMGFYPADIDMPMWMRDVRTMHNHLLCEHNIPLLSKAGSEGGYWVAGDETEAAEFYGTFRRRGLTGLVKASRGKQSAMVDMVTQLSFEFDELLDMTDKSSEQPAHRDATPIEVVDAFLKKMTENPEQYAAGLRKIGEKYGSVLLPRKRYEAIVEGMRKKAAEIQAMVEELEA